MGIAISCIEMYIKNDDGSTLANSIWPNEKLNDFLHGSGLLIIKEQATQTSLTILFFLNTLKYICI